MIIQAGAALPSRRATIKDVARELEISVATVSRALSKPHLLRPATVARVREAVDRMGYRPNLVAQNLKLGSTRTVYAVIPALSPFFYDVFRGIERAALELGYSAIVAHTGRDPLREGEYFDQVSCGRADGVLLISTAQMEIEPPHKHALPPTVMVLESHGQKFPAVRVDHVAARLRLASEVPGDARGGEGGEDDARRSLERKVDARRKRPREGPLAPQARDDDAREEQV